MAKSAPTPSPATPSSARKRWLVFTLSGAVAAGVVYWGLPPQPPTLDATVALPQTDLSLLPTELRTRISSLQTKLLEGGDFIENLTQLGRLAHASDLSETANACWGQLSRIDPSNPRWPYLLADLARARRDNSGELAALLKSWKLDPTYAPTALHLGNLYFRLGQLDDAATAFKSRIALEPTDPHARLGLARIAQREGRTDDRLRWLREIVEIAPEFPTAHNLLAAELSATGDVEGARKHRWLGHSAGRWKQASDPWLDDLEKECYDVNRLYVLTTRDFQLNRNDRALQWIERIAKLRPSNFENLEFLGDLQLKLGNLSPAIEAMNRALALDRQTPPSVTLFSNLAEAYRLQGRPELALESAAAGLKLHPDAFELHNSVGVSFSALNKKTEAIAAFRRSVALQPFDADANFNLGYSLLEQGDEAAALTSLRQALVKQPTFSKALMWLAQYEFNAGEMSEARLLIERLYDAYWGVPEVRRLWAEWHFKAGAIASTSDAQQAETLYRAGLKIDDGLSDLHLGLGALLVGEKRILEAKAALFRVQELTPEDPRGFLYMGQALLAEGQTTAARQQLQLGLDLATLSGQSATAERCRQLLRTL